jgi:SAM-dependent methyltransferase
VASTEKTFDVALWTVHADRGAALACAQQLTRCGLRVQIASPERPTSSARTNVVVVGRGIGAEGDGRTDFALSIADPVIMTLVAPGVPATDLPRLTPSLPGRVWDARSSWEDPAAWRTISAYILDAGLAGETHIDARRRLSPADLRLATIDSYDQIAGQFADRWFEHPPRRELEQFLGRLRPRARVLDAGCGPGHHAALLARAGHDVVGIDLSEGMLAQARQRTHGIRLLQMDLEALQFQDHEFDAIWSAAAIHHIPREHLQGVLEGFWRVLAPSGTLGLNFQVGRRSELVQYGLDRRFFEYYDEREVAELLGSVGFSIDGGLDGETTRNTHGLELTLKWKTLYATRCSPVDAGDRRIAGEDRLT